MKGFAVILLLGGLVGCKRSDTTNQSPRELFASTCARCHGAEGTGGMAMLGAPSPQNFHDHAFQMARTDEQLKQTIKNGKGAAMPAFGTMLTDDQVASLVTQIRSFDGEKK